jgi:Tol biopolymer transport system component
LHFARDQGGGPAVDVMNADGTNTQPLTDEDGVIDRHPSWQPLTR